MGRWSTWNKFKLGRGSENKTRNMHVYNNAYKRVYAMILLIQLREHMLVLAFDVFAP